MENTKQPDTVHYELLFIISNKYSEDELKPIVEKIRQAVIDSGGRITYGETWGKKHLAYPIKGERYGYYELLEFDGEREKSSVLDRSLRLINEVIRYMLVVKKVKTKEKIERDKKIAAKIADKAAKEETKIKQKEETRDKKKVDMKELDEKLDKILEADDLL